MTCPTCGLPCCPPCCVCCGTLVWLDEMVLWFKPIGASVPLKGEGGHSVQDGAAMKRAAGRKQRGQGKLKPARETVLVVQTSATVAVSWKCPEVWSGEDYKSG